MTRDTYIHISAVILSQSQSREITQCENRELFKRNRVEWLPDLRQSSRMASRPTTIESNGSQTYDNRVEWVPDLRQSSRMAPDLRQSSRMVSGRQMSYKRLGPVVRRKNSTIHQTYLHSADKNPYKIYGVVHIVRRIALSTSRTTDGPLGIFTLWLKTHRSIYLLIHSTYELLKHYQSGSIIIVMKCFVLNVILRTHPFYQPLGIPVSLYSTGSPNKKKGIPTNNVSSPFTVITTLFPVRLCCKKNVTRHFLNINRGFCF